MKEIKALKQKHKKELEEVTQSLVPEFKKFITDKNIPLYERWKVFNEAPDELSHYLEVYLGCYYVSRRSLDKNLLGFTCDS